MAKRPVTMSLRDEDLATLDALAAEHRLSRGDAVGMLLEGRLTPQKPSRVPTPTSVIAVRPEKVAGVPTLEKSEVPGVIDPVELARAVKAEALKQALRMTEKRVGVKPVVVEGDELKPDPDAWEEPP